MVHLVKHSLVPQKYQRTGKIKQIRQSKNLLLKAMAKQKRKTHANAYRRARTTSQFATARAVPRLPRITMRIPQLQRIVGSMRVRWTRPPLITVAPPARTAWQVSKPKPILPPAKRLLPTKALYQLPHATGVCVRRKQRKQVILAMTRGKGLASSQQKPRRYNPNSEFKC
ncbi:hypothetical protein [Microviridae sp.]|nr:hypothetical protein [Microviridae sp.]